MPGRVCGARGEILYTDLKEWIMTRAHLSESSAKRRIKQWLSIGMIKQGTLGGCLPHLMQWVLGSRGL